MVTAMDARWRISYEALQQSNRQPAFRMASLTTESDTAHQDFSGIFR
jgi:hypothetical protein